MSRSTPAFPRPDVITADGLQWEGGHPGMSLRDWLAGQAIAGILANSDISASAARGFVTTEEFRIATAQGAYAVADAMLAEREK